MRGIMYPYALAFLVGLGLSNANPAPGPTIAPREPFFTPARLSVARDGTNLGTVNALNLFRRQTCASGYGYCANLGGCCPASDKCCGYGYCLEPQQACCPSGPCGSGKTCCGSSHCMPIGAQCCADESYCEAGNECILWTMSTGQQEVVCCTNQQCTAYVSDGSTYSRTTSTKAATSSTTEISTTSVVEWSYYYVTVTWTYYYYFYTYLAYIDVTIVTSEITSWEDTVSVYATNEAAASSSLAEVTATLTYYPPASATSLASIAGKTVSAGGGTGTGGAGASSTTPSSGTKTVLNSTGSATATLATVGSSGGMSTRTLSLGGSDKILVGAMVAWLGVGIVAVLL